MKHILLIMIGLSILNAEIIRDSNGIVTDTSTKLQWQDDTVGFVIVDWEPAINRCESLFLGGYSDWRLPNINELKSIVDRSKISPAIVDGFVNTSSNRYWSSTNRVSVIMEYAWTVDFSDGDSVQTNKTNSYFTYVRCVRDGE